MIWKVFYFNHGVYTHKFVKADTAEQAIKRSKVKRIIDLQISDIISVKH